MSSRRLKDSRQTSVVTPVVELEVRHSNFRKLEEEVAGPHLRLLASSLHLLGEIVDRKRPELWGANSALRDYLHGLGDLLDLYLLKRRIQSLQPNADVGLSVSIDPSDSGFPVFLRDFHFLLKDRQQAAANLSSIPNDNQLVDHALFTLFRGLFPSDVVLQKLQRDYWNGLLQFELPDPFRMYPAVLEREDDGVHYCRLQVERLDPDHNLPRFYTVYFTTPHWTGDGDAFTRILEEPFHKGTSTVSDMELPFLARAIDRIGGMRLEMIERFDVGPFYSRWTDNRGPAQRLLSSGQETDFMMFIRRYAVHRAADQQHKNLWDRLVSWSTGSSAPGEFTPTLASPWYSVMPHRLIQRVHLEDLDLEDHVVMYGVTEEGELLD